MLDQETKKRIDTARNILVGKVPDPKAQVEQITIALIYKFMDDMDREAQELGGKTRFFTGEYVKYSWVKLMDTRVGGSERLNLYGEAITQMSQNANLPQLFRDIFNGAFLPYRDPETLNLFLKEINGFVYDHSERLGDAFEYLLSVLGSQGDAGQFRTPRHIIDFIVQVVNPQKNESVLDPACGTAGFLISAYKHVLNQNKDKKVGDKLTPEEKKKMMSKYVGYDISPDMDRLSRVNMYLHGFPTPMIYEYDTLTSEDRWNETYDVILANPPFMTPTGGIRPHKRFSIQANRSEVLFVDYIAEHLNVQGRAGIIVPEGIIFQSANAYKDLRKMLVEGGYLYAVVSLPAGVFNPYSGVKTSILILDKVLAKKSKEVLFIKVENDGFDLGAQRGSIDKDDLPEAFEILNKWKSGQKSESLLAIYVDKGKMASGEDYNFSSDRYRIAIDYSNAKWPVVELGQICETTSGGTPLKSRIEYYQNGIIPWLRSGEVAQGEVTQAELYITEEGLRESSAKIFPKNTVLVAMYGATAGEVGFLKFESSTNQAICGILPNGKLIPRFLFYILKSKKNEMASLAGGGAQPNISQNIIKKIKIPVPPLEIQQQIVIDLDGYQNIISGARQIIENWKPAFNIDPEWGMVKLGDICDVRDGTHDSPKPLEKGYPLITSKNIKDGKLDFSNITYISEDDFKKVSQRSYVDIGDIIMPMIGTIGGSYLVDSKPAEFAIKNVALFKKSEIILPKFLSILLDSDYVMEKLVNGSAGSTQKFVSLGILRALIIPLPPLEIQKHIVEKVEVEKELVNSSKKLVEIYEQKTKDRIAKVWV